MHKNSYALPPNVNSDFVNSYRRVDEHWYTDGHNIIDGVDPGIIIGLPRTEDVVFVFVERDGSSNLFHCMADLVQTYSSVTRILGNDYKPDSIQLVFTDDDPNHREIGRYKKLWQIISGKVPLFASQFEKPMITQRAIFVPHGQHAATWCTNSYSYNDNQFEDVHNWAQKVVSTFPVWSLSNSIGTHQLPVVVWIMRRKNIEHHVKTGVGRVIINENELLTALRNSGILSKVDVVMVDLVDLSIEQQIGLMRKAKILIGMHGAGLTHCMFLDSTINPLVIELMPPQFESKSFSHLCSHIMKFNYRHFYPEVDELQSHIVGSGRDDVLWLQEKRIVDFFETVILSWIYK